MWTNTIFERPIARPSTNVPLFRRLTANQIQTHLNPIDPLWPPLLKRQPVFGEAFARRATTTTAERPPRNRPQPNLPPPQPNLTPPAKPDLPSHT